MKEAKISIEINKKDISDIASLKNLFINSGYCIEFMQTSEKKNMGLEIGTLLVLIPAISTAIVELASILKVWLKNRDSEVVIKNIEKGKEITIKASNGKIDTKLYEKIKELIEDE